jgi:hypothetical protein
MIKNDEDTEVFYAKVVKIGGKSYGVIIPAPTVFAKGWDSETRLKLWVKEVTKNKSEDKKIGRNARDAK